MRRLIGLILLLALVVGAGWLLTNSQQQAQNAGEPTVFEPARSADESVPPPDVADAPPAAESPETDIASAPAKPEAPESAPPAAGAETPAPGTATTEPAPAEDMGLDDAPPAADAVPTFDVVRVEPSGDTVIAGLAAPEAKVEVLDGAEPLATAEANERGEWALVLDAPLEPGTHDLAIRTTSPDKSVVTLSDQRVAVQVPDGEGEPPLVVLNSPDAPSQVMQVPAEPEVAAAPEAPAMSEAPAMPESSPTPETSAAPQMPEVAAAPEAPSAPEAPATAAAPEPSATPEAATPSPTAPSAAPGETEIASVPPPAAEPTPEATAPMTAPETSEPPMATAPTPGTMPPAAEAPEMPAPGGTATTEELAPSSEPTPSTGPAPEIATAPPQTDAPAASSPEAPAPPAVAEAPAEPPAPEEPKPPEPKVGVAAVEAETNGALYIAGTATTREPVRVYVDDELVGEATPTEGGTWLIETNRELPPGEYTVRADQVEEGSGRVVVRAEVPFEREIEVAVLKQSNESADPGGAEISGSVAGPMSVIIKRGDNLWRISREMYGHGVRYSTIYQANKDQIRNPDRIYPGQVFMLPQGDTAWQN